MNKLVISAVAALAGCSTVGTVSAVERNLTMCLPFDGTAEAEVAGGAKAPVASGGLEFGPGRFGQAVRLTEKAKSVLAYAAKGNLDWKRGTMSFWLKRDALGGSRPRAILALEKAEKPGWGRFSFAFSKGDKGLNDRDALNSTPLNPALGAWAVETGVWQHWVVTWGVRDRGMLVYCGGDGTREFQRYIAEEESCRIMPKKVERRASFAPEATAPERFFLGCGEGKDVLPVEGWLDEVRIYDRQFSSEEVKGLFERDRRAVIVSAPHFGLADEERTLKVALEPRTADLAGAEVELVDAEGKVIASAPCAKNARAVTLKAKLPMGKYLYRLVKGGELLARDTYTVLRANNPYELPATDRPGEPLNLRFVKAIKPDLATLTTNEFRALGKCRMGTLDGQTYLEGGKNDKDRFALRFSLPTDKPLYLIDIIYPDDRFRTMDYLIQATNDKSGRYGTGGEHSFAQGVSTGGEFPNTMKMQHHRCLYWSGKSEDLTFIAMSWQPGAPAAVSEIRIYEVVDAALPVAKVDVCAANDDPMGRQFGQFWEDPNLSGAFRVRMSTPESFSEQIDRYAALMRYCGQNVLSYPGAWYRGTITAANDARQNSHVDHFLEGYYAKFEKEGLYVMPNVEFIHVFNPPDIEPTPEAISNGSLHAYHYPIQSSGLPAQVFNHGLPPVSNFFHPETQREIEDMIRALVRDGAPYRSFKGVSLQLYRDGAGWWGDITSGYNDYCIEAFERDTGIRVPVDRADPLRGKAYYEWLMANRRKEWVDWRCDKFTEFYARMAKILSDARPDLRLWFIAAPKFDGVFRLEDNPDYFSEDFASRSLKDAGLDGEKVAKAIPNAIVGVTVHPQRHRKRWYWMNTDEKRERYIGLPAGEGYYREMQKSAFPHVTCRDEFMEYNVWPNPKKPNKKSLSGDWLTELGWRCSTVNGSGVNAMRYFLVPLRHGDVLGFTRGSFLFCDYGYEPLEARFAQAFRALPDVKMADHSYTTDAPDFVRVRTAEKGGRRWYYAVNTEAKPAKVSFVVGGVVRDLVSGEAFDGTVEFSLAPYELRSFVTK